MNKVNVIKQNLEFIGKMWMKCIGTCLLYTSDAADE